MFGLHSLVLRITLATWSVSGDEPWLFLWNVFQSVHEAVHEPEGRIKTQPTFASLAWLLEKLFPDVCICSGVPSHFTWPGFHQKGCLFSCREWTSVWGSWWALQNLLLLYLFKEKCCVCTKVLCKPPPSHTLHSPNIDAWKILAEQTVLHHSAAICT